MRRVVLFLACLVASYGAAMDAAVACTNQWEALDNHCPPENPTPPGGNTCMGCAIAIQNCHRYCGIACDDFDGYYPEPGEDNDGYVCPLPWRKYRGGTVVIGDISDAVLSLEDGSSMALK